MRKRHQGVNHVGKDRSPLVPPGNPAGPAGKTASVCGLQPSSGSGTSPQVRGWLGLGGEEAWKTTVYLI